MSTMSTLRIIPSLVSAKRALVLGRLGRKKGSLVVTASLLDIVIVVLL
jgi:hypothetical protein